VLARGMRELARDARAAIARDGVAHPRLEPALDVRYAGQSYELTVPFGPAWRRDFHGRHRLRFGHAAPGRPLEVVTLRMRARGERLHLPRAAGRHGRGAPPRRERPVVFGSRTWSAPVLRRDELSPGVACSGPAVICEYSATTVVPPGWLARVAPRGGLVLEDRDG
jgi:N-methylhydantoinase A